MCWWVSNPSNGVPLHYLCSKRRRRRMAFPHVFPRILTFRGISDRRHSHSMDVIRPSISEQRLHPLGPTLDSTWICHFPLPQVFPRESNETSNSPKRQGSPSAHLTVQAVDPC